MTSSKAWEMGTSMSLEEHASIVFRKPVPRLNLPAGAVGVVVHVHIAGEAYEVELFDSAGATTGVETFIAAELELLDVEVFGT